MKTGASIPEVASATWSFRFRVTEQRLESRASMCLESFSSGFGTWPCHLLAV